MTSKFSQLQGNIILENCFDVNKLLARCTPSQWSIVLPLVYEVGLNMKTYSMCPQRICCCATSYVMRYVCKIVPVSLKLCILTGYWAREELTVISSSYPPKNVSKDMTAAYPLRIFTTTDLCGIILSCF